MGGLLVLTGIAFLTGAVTQASYLAAGYVSGAGEDRVPHSAPRSGETGSCLSRFTTRDETAEMDSGYACEASSRFAPDSVISS